MENLKNKHLDIIACVGLALGGVLGMLGSFVPSVSLRGLFWGIDGTGIVVACAILTVRFLRQGKDAVAAGFFVFAIAEGVMLTSAGTSLSAGVPFFGAGIVLWSAALFLIGISKEFPFWNRLTGYIAAILFVVTAFRIFWGEQILATDSPLPSLAYPFLVITFGGWIWKLLKK